MTYLKILEVEDVVYWRYESVQAAGAENALTVTQADNGDLQLSTLLRSIGLEMPVHILWLLFHQSLSRST